MKKNYFNKQIVCFILFVLALNGCAVYKYIAISRNTKPIEKQYPNLKTLDYGQYSAYEFKVEENLPYKPFEYIYVESATHHTFLNSIKEL